MKIENFIKELAEHLWLADSQRFTTYHPTRDQYAERIKKFCEIYHIAGFATREDHTND